ncbi:MAG: ABC transporter permease [Bacteriovoracaceae bacterium]
MRWKLPWLEFKKDPRFFALLIFTQVLGMLGLLLVEQWSGVLEQRLKDKGQELLGADLSISVRRPFTDEEQKIIQEKVNPVADEMAELIDTYSMVYFGPEKESRLTELRGVKGNFPFYGKIQLASGQSFSNQIIVDEELKHLLNLKPQDQISFGPVQGTIFDFMVKDDTAGLRGFSLASRVYIPMERLLESELIQFGSTATFAKFFKISKLSSTALDELQKELLATFTDAAVKVSRPQDASEQIGRVLSIVSDFLGLSSLIAFILSLLGLLYLWRSYWHRKIKDLTMWQVLGLTKKSLLGLLIYQVICLSLLSSFIVILLWLGIQIPSESILENMTGVDFSFEVIWFTLGREIAVFLLFPLLLLIPQMSLMSRISKHQLIRGQQEMTLQPQWWNYLPVVLLLWGYACWIAHSFKIGSLFWGLLLGTFFIGYLVFLLLRKIVKGILRPGERISINNKLTTGLALRSWWRSPQAMLMSFLSFCLCSCLFMFLLELEGMIQSDLAITSKRPQIFLFDIQEEQKESLENWMSDNKLELEALTPMIRAKLEKVNGKSFEKSISSQGPRTREDEVESRFRNRGLNLTIRQNLTESESIISGEKFKATYQEGDKYPLVSIERRFAGRLNIELGDILTIDVQGVPVEAKVTNLRRVNWTSFYPNFFVSFQEGVIEEAPKTFLAVLSKLTPSEKRVVLRELPKDFGNVSMIDVEKLITKLTALFEQVAKALKVMSLLGLLVGVVILYSIVIDQIYLRRYDFMLQKSLGMTAREIRSGLHTEMFVTLFLSFSLGALLGYLMAMLIGVEVFALDWSFPSTSNLIKVFLLMLGAFFILSLASKRVLKYHPRGLLAEN